MHGPTSHVCRATPYAPAASFIQHKKGSDDVCTDGLNPVTPSVVPHPSPQCPQNDVHNRIDSQNAQGGYCPDAEDEAGRCFGGYGRIAAAVAEARRKDPGGEGGW